MKNPKKNVCIRNHHIAFGKHFPDLILRLHLNYFQTNMSIIIFAISTFLNG